MVGSGLRPLIYVNPNVGIVRGFGRDLGAQARIISEELLCPNLLSAVL